MTSKTPGAGTYLPTIKLTQYDTYTRNDIGSKMPDGTVITEKEVGMRKGTYTVLETVTSVSYTHLDVYKRQLLYI